MHVSRICDLPQNGVLAIDLRHVLRTLGPHAMQSVWEIAEETSFNEPLAAVGDEADRLENLSKHSNRIDGTKLLQIAEAVDQVIWGEFRAYESAASDRPWVIVRAVDSTFYEVESDDLTVHNDLQRSFSDVRGE